MSTLPRPTEAEVRRESADSPVAAEMIRSFVAEIDRALPGGFDPALSVSADPHELTPPSGVFLVAWSHAKPVGCGGLKILSKDTAEIKRMWVDPAVRGHGVAKTLVAALEAEARGFGARRVVLDTSERLPLASRLYRRCGYAETAPYNDNFYADLWFSKDL